MTVSHGALADVSPSTRSPTGPPVAARRAASRALPAADELHLWVLDLDEPASGSDAVTACLSPAERSRANRLLRVEQRRRWQACRSALRHILGGYLGVDAAAVPLDRGPAGKPFIRQSANPRELRFNLSHSGNLAVLVVGIDVELGVDVELTRPLRAFDSLVMRCLAEEERQAIQRVPPHDRQRAFLRLWTHKEAFLKAIGSGIQRPLTSVVVDMTRTCSRVSDRSGLPASTGLEGSELMLAVDGYGAVAWLDSSPRKLVEHRWQAEALERPAADRPDDAPAPKAVAPVIMPRSAEEITEWIAEYLSRDAGIPADSIDTAASFDTFGLDSAVAIEMTGDLERWLGIPVDPMLLYDHPTIDALAGHLAARFDSP